MTKSPMKRPDLCFLSCLLFFTGAAAFAEEPCCWINAKTGKPVPSERLLPEHAKFSDVNHASVPSGPTVPGTDYVRLPNGSWINAKTGKPVACDRILPEHARFSDPNHASVPSGPTVPGTDFVRVPCPSPTPASQRAGNTIKNVLSGLSIGVGGGYNVGHNDHGSHQKRTNSTTSSKKTVTTGCKCHPCTCSPCTCH